MAKSTFYPQTPTHLLGSLSREAQAKASPLGREMSLLLRRWRRYVPVAGLAALIAPAALAPQGELELGLRAWAMLAWAEEKSAGQHCLALPV